MLLVLVFLTVRENFHAKRVELTFIFSGRESPTNKRHYTIAQSGNPIDFLQTRELTFHHVRFLCKKAARNVESRATRALERSCEIMPINNGPRRELARREEHATVFAVASQHIAAC